MVNTTVAIQKHTYTKLLKVKHRLEKEKDRTCTFSETIDFLIKTGGFNNGE